MPLYFVRDDITRMKTDAIVLPANPLLEPGPGTSNAIYVAAGQERLAGELRLRYPNGCELGKAVITHGYDLPAKWIIHAVCPQWLGGDQGEQDFLESVYKESLKLAKNNKCGSISFPLLSAGSYRFPRFDAIKIGVNTIIDFLTGNPAQFLYEKLGFQHEGMLRKNCRKNGILYDVHLMSMLAEEYTGGTTE